MKKWADFLISAVRYEEEMSKKIITHCKVHPDNGDTIGEGTTWTKEEVLEALNSGYTFLTIRKVENGKWKKGNRFNVINVEKVYLRTCQAHRDLHVNWLPPKQFVSDSSPARDHPSNIVLACLCGSYTAVAAQ